MLPPQPSASGITHEDTETLVLDRSGRLSVTNPAHGIDTEIGTSIESFWYSGAALDPQRPLQLQYSLWTYSEGGLYALFPFTGSRSLSAVTSEVPSGGLKMIAMTPENSLQFDNELYPVGCSNEQGVIIGLSQVTSYSSAAPFPRYDVMVRPQPFLHTLLGGLIASKQVSVAMEVAQSHSQLRHFEHSLELLLHETLEDDSDSLPAVIDFLSQFVIYPQIIGRCARKTDVSHWDLLFSQAGTPVDLFCLCIGRNLIEPAMCFLRVIQIVHDLEEARQAGLMLLEAILEHDLLPLLPDLLRFLEMDRYEGLDEETDILQGPAASLVSVKEENGEQSKDPILGRYARRLLSEIGRAHV